jgi:CDP-glycerol glycerophosphotransferase (TagB/SpsB family)
VNKNKRNIMYAIARFLSLINRIIPKNKKLILFYDSMNECLTDNTEAIYNYIHNKSTKYKLVSCIPNCKKKDINTVGTIRGVLTYLRATYVFYSFGDFRIQPSKKQIVINQWHGAPIKAIGKITNQEIYQKERLDNFTYLTSTSPLFSKVMQKAFDCDKDKIIPIGQARNDYLFSDKEVLSYLNIKKEKYKKLILWMPTFRVSKDKRFFDSEIKNKETLLPILESTNDLIKLNDLLCDENIFLVIKIHEHSDFNKIDFSNIKSITNREILPKGVKLYEFVKEFDALITDYSSIFVDYLILNRPIGFTLDDYNSYLENRGFSIDNPINMMPGHHILNYEDFINFILDISNSYDKYEIDRYNILKLTNSYYDNKNCERLIKLAGIEL